MEKQPSLLLYLAWMFFLQSCWFSFMVYASSLSRTNHLNNFTDQVALLTFKSHITRDPNNSLSNSWHTNTSFCNWIGVSCSRHRQRVTELILLDMDLEGTIPPHIANLSFLVYLDLGNNSFHGHLSCALENLRRLKAIDLRNNKLEVSFAGNIISGQLPVDTGRFLPNLEELYLTKNQMSGPIPISLSNASKLTRLSLARNSFSGSIPGTLGHLLHLEGLVLQENNLTEYGLVGKVSAKGDVYSYGILLLEMLTRKKPTDIMFIGELSLRQWVNAVFPNEIIDVVDTNLLGEISSRGNNYEEVDDLHGRQQSCLLSIAEVGLLCSMESAEERINMKDVMVRLMKIKKKFLSM